MRSPRARPTASSSSLSVTENARREWVAALCVVVAVYLFLVIAVQRIEESSEWVTGDWLINYSNGFIRRGLIGEVGRQLYYAAGVSPVWIIVICKALCYATICLSLLLLAAKRTIGLIEIALLIWPALLPFEINDPLGSGRKEIVLLALFALYVVADELLPYTGKRPQQTWRFWYLLLTLPVLTLIHEGLFFFFPFFFVYAWMKRDDVRGEVLLFGVPYLVSACVLALSWLFRGSSGIAAAMCSSLMSMALNPNLCGGAVAALERYDMRVGNADVQRFLLLTILTFGPLLWYGAQAISSRGHRLFLTGVGLAALSTAPLYVMSEDWGRWLHMTAMLVFVTILACKDINVHLPVRRPALAVPFVAAIAIIAFSWQLPHWIHAPIPVVRPWAQHALVQLPGYVFHAGTR